MNTPGQLFSNTVNKKGCVGGRKRRRRRRKRGNKMKGGTKLYGPTISSLRHQSNIGAGRGVIPHDTTSTCNQSGGGLSFTEFNGSGHRPILNKPGYGYTQDNTSDNKILAGARPQVSSYNVAACSGGAKTKRRRRRRRRKTNSLSKKKRRKTRKTKKRKRKRRTRRRRRKLIGCGQKGGSKLDSTWNPTISFPGKFNMNLGDYRLGVGHGIKTNAYNNCFDNYNHYK